MRANATGVAELTVGLIFSACHYIRVTARGTREGGWPGLKGSEIEGTTMGIVGPEAIARRVARILDSLGARIMGHDPLRPDTGELLMDYVGPNEPLSRSEVVTLHCPFPTDGQPPLDTLALARLPRGATVASTACTKLLDVQTLLAALDGDQIETCAPDVFATELLEDDPLAAHPRVMTTSHTGPLTEANVTCTTEVAVENLLPAFRAPAHAPG